MRYALIDTTNSTVMDLREMAARPPDPVGKPRKWLPCPAGVQPVIDPALESITGPTMTVSATDVVETWGKRNLTAQEISDAKDAAVAIVAAGTFTPLFKVLHNLNNRLRVLEGQAALTPAQFRAAIKALL